MRRTVMLVALMVFLTAMLAEAEVLEASPAGESEGISIQSVVPDFARILPTREATEFCSEEAREALRQAGLGMRPPDGYEAPPWVPSESRCDLVPSACAYIESEPWCYDDYEDASNGGCNSNPYVFDILTPSYGTIEVAGTGGVYDYFGSPYRDTDWYEITVLEQISVTWRCTAEFPLAMFLIDSGLGCDGGFTILEFITAEECVEGVMQLNLAPGTHWLFVAASDWGAYPCGSDYVMTFEGLHAAPDCVGSCPFGSMEEQEPPCEPGHEDHYNGGCNSSPYVFQDVEPMDGQLVVCGETGIFPSPGGLCYRDTDWYELVLDEPRDVTFCLMAGFDYQLGLIDGNFGCPAGGFLYSLYGPPCDVVCDTWSLSPGVYWLWVGSSNWLPVDCGRKYVVTIDGYTTPVDDRTWGSLKALYR